jgi:arylsulfatase A-like enzyme
MFRDRGTTALLAAGIWLLSGMAFAGNVLPQPPASFKGRMAATLSDSVPDWPKPVQAPQDAPNIVLILLDDAGFAATSTFGGPAATPELDKLAAQGLRYNQFNTSGLCSPTRAALLTGRNPHQAGYGHTPEIALGFPGYDQHWGGDMASVAEVLRLNGYSTSGFGKWHNTPTGETGPTGPFDRWPTRLGFEYFYGFHGGATSQWEPRLFRNTLFVDPPGSVEQGYHLTNDLVNDAAIWLHQHASLAAEKPYFLYFAPAAVHDPHHVPQQWIDRYRGKFDQGWDKIREEIFARQKASGVIPANAELTPRPKEIPAWDSLNVDEQRLSVRQMEVFAGFVSQTDHEVGRLLTEVNRLPGGRSTLVIYLVGDNGGSGHGDYRNNFLAVPDVKDSVAHLDELGGPLHMNNFAAAWGWATSTPFQWMKEVVSHFGATRNPMVVTWPGHIPDPGGLRSQFQYVTDVAPTIYQVAGIGFPETVHGVRQAPLEGRSFAATFTHPDAPGSHPLQYFEIHGHRSLYDRGWIAGARHSVPWDFDSGMHDPSLDRWELYHVAEDYSQAHDLARQHPDKLEAMKRKFDQEARRNNVYPLAPVDTRRVKSSGFRVPNPADGKTGFDFFAGQERVPNYVLPVLQRTSHSMKTRVRIPPEGARGILLAAGNREAGFAWFIKDGRLHYDNNLDGRHDVISSTVTVPFGRAVDLEFRYRMRAEGGGVGSLYIDGTPVGSSTIKGLAGIPTNQFLEIGEQRQGPSSPGYEVPYRFTGSIERMRIDLD